MCNSGNCGIVGNRPNLTAFPTLSNGGRGGLFPEGKAQVQELVKFYLQNATIIREKLTAAGLEVHGGVNAPYVWVKTPRVYQVGISSINCYIPVMWWEPRIWLWAAREGYFRLSAFNSRANVEAAMERIIGKFQG
jgi:LL-diaminopimelate aminotransferase